MLQAKANRRTFQIQGGSFADAYAFVKDMLSRKDVSDEAAKETLLVFEALMQALIDWGLDEGACLEVSGTDRLGVFTVKVAFEGKFFTRDGDAVNSIEGRILDAHDDKVNYSYYSGRNEISITVSRGGRTSLFACAIASLCAIAVYVPLSFAIDAQAQHDLYESYVFPLETMYTNAMLMIGAPMTFFSLLKNLTNTYVVSQRSSGIPGLQVRTLATSVLAILLAFVTFSALSIPLDYLDSSLYGATTVLGGSFDGSFADLVNSFMPASIFKSFEAASPIPLMILALLCTYALCSAGKYFETLRHATMACYTLFSRMLHIVIAVLPAFCFLAVMDLLLDAGLAAIVEALGYFVVTILGILLLFATYAIRLRVHGVPVVPFIRKLIPLLRENMQIGSVINAVPYNTRYCSRVFRMRREMLERYLPVLAEINLDGNCFLLVFFALAFAFAMGARLPWLNVVGLALLALFLSLGAPNQPGSILIGMVIILTYLGLTEEICLALIAEAFFGGLQNIINVIGDVVMVAIEEARERKLAESA